MRRFGRVVSGLAVIAPLASCATVGAAGCGSEAAAVDQAVASADASDGAACAGPRTLTCAFFDGTTRTWSDNPPTRVSLAEACGAGGAHGEVDAYVQTEGQYWLDHLGFTATGSAVRTADLCASDPAGGQTYGCGQGGGKVLTQLLCGNDVGTGTLALRFDFAGHWADGTPWTKECDASVTIEP